MNDTNLENKKALANAINENQRATIEQRTLAGLANGDIIQYGISESEVHGVNNLRITFGERGKTPDEIERELTALRKIRSDTPMKPSDYRRNPASTAAATLAPIPEPGPSTTAAVITPRKFSAGRDSAGSGGTPIVNNDNRKMAPAPVFGGGGTSVVNNASGFSIGSGGTRTPKQKHMTAH